MLNIRYMHRYCSFSQIAKYIVCSVDYCVQYLFYTITDYRVHVQCRHIPRSAHSVAVSDD